MSDVCPKCKELRGQVRNLKTDIGRQMAMKEGAEQRLEFANRLIAELERERDEAYNRVVQMRLDSLEELKVVIAERDRYKAELETKSCERS